jgi:hypothetical protein
MRALFDSLGSNETLRLLDLSYNALNFSFMPSESFAAFGRNATLRYLLINDNRLVWDDASAEAFSLFLGHLPLKLAHLNLNLVGLDATHLPLLHEALMTRPTLRHLVLSDNLLGTDAIDALGRLLAENANLRSLNLGANNLWDGGARQLARHLEANGALLALRLERNRIGRAALDLVQALLRGRAASRLRVLDLRLNGVSGEVGEQIKALIAAQRSPLNVLLDYGDV